jgi:hypothetical protein
VQVAAAVEVNGVLGSGSGLGAAGGTHGAAVREAKLGQSGAKAGLLIVALRRYCARVRDR